MESWIYVLIYGSVFSPVLPLFFVWKKFTLYQKVILLFIVLSFSTDLITLFLIDGYNLHILKIYGLVEALVLFWFYGIVLDKSRQWLVIVIPFFIILYFISTYYLDSGNFNAFGRSLQSIIFIVLSLMLFYQFYHKEEDIFIERSPLFWINVAVLVYFAGALFSFALSKIMEINMLSWIFHNLSNILKNIILAVGLWKVRSK